MMTVRISSTGEVFPLLKYVRKIEQKMRTEDLKNKKKCKTKYRRKRT